MKSFIFLTVLVLSFSMTAFAVESSAARIEGQSSNMNTGDQFKFAHLDLDSIDDKLHTEKYVDKDSHCKIYAKNPLNGNIRSNDVWTVKQSSDQQVVLTKASHELVIEPSSMNHSCDLAAFVEASGAEMEEFKDGTSSSQVLSK